MMENGIQCLARKGVLHQVNQEATLLKKVGVQSMESQRVGHN